MAYYVGDIPSEDIVIEPARNGEAIDLSPFVAADSTTLLRDFDGNVIPADFLVTFDGQDVIVEWPGTTVFAEPGLYTLSVILEGPVARERLKPVYLVVQSDDGWHTIDSAREVWVNAPENENRLFQLLELARQQVEEYAPALMLGARIPANYVEGQLMQARNLLNAGMVNPSGETGEDDFVLRPFPLDWMVKQVLRPKRAIPAVQ